MIEGTGERHKDARSEPESTIGEKMGQGKGSDVIASGEGHKGPSTAKKRPSMRKAINDKCKECIYDPLAGLGNWRQQVEGCTSPDCALYELRPISKPRKEKSDA